MAFSEKSVRLQKKNIKKHNIERKMLVERRGCVCVPERLLLRIADICAEFWRFVWCEGGWEYSAKIERKIFVPSKQVLYFLKLPILRFIQIDCVEFWSVKILMGFWWDLIEKLFNDRYNVFDSNTVYPTRNRQDRNWTGFFTLNCYTTTEYCELNQSWT